MKHGRKFVIDTLVKANSFPELAGILLPAIGYNIVSYATVADHVLEQHSCQLCVTALSSVRG
jgi:hypothetical protein